MVYDLWSPVWTWPNGIVLDGARLHVPVGTKELYANAEGWKDFSSIVEGDGPEKGDANGDGVVNAADIVDVVNHLMGKPTSTGEFYDSAADVNGDGIVNIADVVCLVTLISQ